MVLSISWVTAPLTETPINTSAPSNASANVLDFVFAACADFHWFMPSVRPWKITPFVSQTIQFS